MEALRPDSILGRVTVGAVRRAPLVMLALLIFGFLIPRWTYSAAPEYVLASGDKLQVTVFGRPDLSGQFEIRATGSISLPLLGSVSAGGETLEGLEALLTTKLRGVFADPPFVNVEVEAYRPFYILGDVAQPGAYSYQHGMTVIRAIALAGGGRYGGGVGLDARVDRQNRERAQLLFQSYLVDMAREARLTAERDGLESMKLPEGFASLRDSARIEEVVETELRIFAIRRDTLQSRLKSAEEEQAHYRRLINELTATKQALEEKARLVAEQLDALTRGADRGVIRKLDLLRIQSTAADTQREVRQNKVAISRAELAAAQAEQTLSGFLRQRRADIATELREVQSRLAQSELQLQTMSGRFDLSQRAKPDRSDQLEHHYDTRYYVRRARGTDPGEIEVSLDEWIFPGDVVRVLAPDAMILLPRRPDVTRVPTANTR